MSNQVGFRVLYQPTSLSGLAAYYQQAAIITGWDEDSGVANLLVFTSASCVEELAPDRRLCPCQLRDSSHRQPRLRHERLQWW